MLSTHKLPKCQGLAKMVLSDIKRGLASWLSAVSFKHEADITLTENDCESQRCLRNSKVVFWYAPQETYSLE